MNLFVTDSNGHKIYLVFPHRITKREDISNSQYFTLVCEQCGELTFSNNEVEVEQDNTSYDIGLMIVFGMIGILFGPGGALIGATIGFTLGSYYIREEKRRIRNFG